MKSEIEQRLEKAQNLMGDRGFAALAFSSAENIQYFTGVVEPSIHACGVVILLQQAKPILAVMWLDKAAAQEQAVEIEIKTYTHDNQEEVITKILERSGTDRNKIGVDERALKRLGNSLRRTFPHAELVDISNTVALRAVKSEEEIRLIQRACKISEQGMKMALESARPGMTELEVAALAEQQMIRLCSDRLKHITMVASGSRASLIHPFATNKKIAEGDLVVVDLGAVYGGYCSDIARTIFIGKPDEEIKNAFDALSTVQDIVLEKLRPGISISEIENIAFESARANGHHLIGFVGHNIGLQVEEYPFIRTAGAADPDLKLEKNMAVAFFQGSIQRKTNVGIRLEDTVLITESGAELLTTYPRALVI
ncbi:MAG: aminopeptidase P family protein [Candidatus Aminicenantes bacterium]|nr:aminopeptidase P family protein [Candidatus Aminicenantes bacterium]